MGEATIDVRVNPDSADVDGSIKYTWKKVVGNSDIWSGPDYEEEETQDCGGGLVELSARTTIALQAFNDDWTSDACFVHANMKCAIRTMDVSVSCSCEGRAKPNDAALDETRGAQRATFERHASLLEQRRSELQALLREFGDIEEPSARSVADEGALEALRRAVSAGFGGTGADGLRNLESAIETESVSRHRELLMGVVKHERQRAGVLQELAIVDLATANLELGYTLDGASLARLLGANRSTGTGGSGR
jgi:hypothetical protein